MVSQTLPESHTSSKSPSHTVVPISLERLLLEVEKQAGPVFYLSQTQNLNMVCFKIRSFKRAKQLINSLNPPRAGFTHENILLCKGRCQKNQYDRSVGGAAVGAQKPVFKTPLQKVSLGLSLSRVVMRKEGARTVRHRACRWGCKSYKLESLFVQKDLQSGKSQNTQHFASMLLVS